MKLLFLFVTTNYLFVTTYCSHFSSCTVPPSPSSPSYAVLSGPSMPIIGEGDEEANDRWVGGEASGRP